MTAKSPFGLVAVLAAILGMGLPVWAQPASGRLTGSVRDESGAGLPNVRVAATDTQGTTTSATTDSSGTYSIPGLKPGVYVVEVSLLGFAPSRQQVTVAAGGSLTVDVTLKVHQLSEEITVTGTRVEGRSATDTPAPVDYISREVILNTGASETGKILQLVEPSFNFSTTTISDGTDIIRPATLRSLGPDQVLVLVNGKRYHQQSLVHYQQTVGRGSAGYDINTIPASAIDHIEVLRDGASAQYGSDAIAGVINVILKREKKVTDVMLEAGQHYAENPELPLGASPDAQLGHGARYLGAVNTGFDVGRDGFVNLTAEYRNRGETNRAGPDSIRVSPPRVTQRIGDGESKDFLLWLNSELPTDNGSFYAFGGYSHRKGNSSGFFRSAGDNRTVPSIYPNGFLPTIISQPTDFHADLGYRAKLGASDWRWDLSGSYGKSRFQFREENTVNVSYFFEPRDPNNPTGPRFGESPNSADTGALGHDQLAVNLDLTGVVKWDLGAGPLHVAAGTEWRREGYEITPGDPVSYQYGRSNNLGIRILGQNGQLAPPGTQGFPGYSPREAVDASRSNFALYADAESQLHQKLLAGVAARFERYSDFGSTVTGKLSARFNATDQVALRGTVSNGFRAPGVQQLFYSSYSINLSGGVLVDTLTARQDSEVTAAFGIPPLKEETSRNYSLGLVAKPTPNFRVTVDAYRIDIDDRIVFSANTAPEPRASCGVPVSATRCPIRGILNRFGFPNVEQVLFFTNAIDTSTKGLDIVALYDATLGDGSKLSLEGAFNFNDTQVKDHRSSSPIFSATALFDGVQGTLVERGQPRQHFIVGGTWRRNSGWSANLRFNYFGKVAGEGFNPGFIQEWGGKWLTDAALTVPLRKDKFSLTVGALNLFDVYPDKWDPVLSGGLNQFGFVYGWETLPFGINGGYYYARVNLRLDR